MTFLHDVGEIADRVMRHLRTPDLLDLRQALEIDRAVGDPEFIRARMAAIDRILAERQERGETKTAG